VAGGIAAPAAHDPEQGRNRGEDDDGPEREHHVARAPLSHQRAALRRRREAQESRVAGAVDRVEHLIEVARGLARKNLPRRRKRLGGGRRVVRISADRHHDGAARLEDADRDAGAIPPDIVGAGAAAGPEGAGGEAHEE
jgi:hypothetical protein